MEDACQRVIGVKSLTRSYPVVSLMVPIYRIGVGRRSGMGHHPTVCIETVDAIILYGTPGYPVITLTEGSYRATDADILR